MKRTLAVITILWLILTAPPASATDRFGEVPTGGTLIGLVTFDGITLDLDNRSRRELDALVPKLKKVGKGALVVIQGYFPIRQETEDSVKLSLYLAQAAGEYLQEKYRLELDFYYGCLNNVKASPGDSQVVRILFYPDIYQKKRHKLEPDG